MRFNQDPYKNLENDDFDVERTIDDVSEDKQREEREKLKGKKSKGSQGEFVGDEDNYNRERGEYPMETTEDKVPSDDSNPAEHLGEVKEKEDVETFDQIVRRSRGYKDKKGRFHSTEPGQIWEAGNGKPKIVKKIGRVSPDERENLIKSAQRRQRREKAIKWLEEHPEEQEQ